LFFTLQNIDVENFAPVIHSLPTRPLLPKNIQPQPRLHPKHHRRLPGHQIHKSAVAERAETLADAEVEAGKDGGFEQGRGTNLGIARKSLEQFIL